ncbi:Aste57867_16199 [Aphanomyces stellatus]|uniref:Aste57867_16199 protein n=1 Tax=Aphanomyces stellatus TaxID=120398 RepID=A0A485L557_9STRA|nr:hypothetical protein As57867_016143 [Aphanomyces stellatus]VFT92977.1 Aste57867_16199 [Aphanomyces stellatus]
MSTLPRPTAQAPHDRTPVLPATPPLDLFGDVARVQHAFEALDWAKMKEYFQRPLAEPFLVVSNVPLKAFYGVFLYDDKPITSFRSVSRNDRGDVFLDELYTRIHGSIKNQVFLDFFEICGRHFACIGSAYASRWDPSTHTLTYQEPEISYIPHHSTQYLKPKPEGLPFFSAWRTIVVDVSCNRPDRLDKIALWWSQYPGIEYILGIYVNQVAAQRIEWQFKLHDMEDEFEVNRPWSPVYTQPPAPGDTASANIELDMRRLLGVLPTAPLPDDGRRVLPDTWMWDLRVFMIDVLDECMW